MYVQLSICHNFIALNLRLLSICEARTKQLLRPFEFHSAWIGSMFYYFDGIKLEMGHLVGLLL